MQRVTIPREVVLSPAELAHRLGCSEAEVRRRCAAGLIPGAFRSGDGRMARWWVFRPMFEQSERAAARSDMVLWKVLRRVLAEARIQIVLPDGPEGRDG
jgi:hypothetical protein